MRLTFILILTTLLGCHTKVIQEFDKNGTLISEYEVASDRVTKDGDYVGYHPNGKIFEECNYKNGKLEGERILYYENGEKQALEMYQDDILQGLYREFYSNAQLSFVGTYVNNEMDGLWKKYDEYGNLVEEVNFKNNNENGPFKEYHKNGKLAAEGSYLNGDFEHGELRLYNEDGNLIKTMDCVEGICKTTWSLESPNN